VAIQKTEAILLSKKDIRETSVVAAFFTKDFGKIKGLVKAVRGPQAKFGIYLHEFAVYDIVFYDRARSDTYMITQCDLLDPYTEIAQNIDKRLKAFYVLELVDKFTALRDDSAGIYELLEWMLDRLQAERFPERSMIIFQMMLLDYTGFLPQLENCIECSRKIDTQGVFSVRLSGLLCQGCLSADSQVIALSKGAIASMNMIRKQKLGKLSSAMITGSLVGELGGMLEGFISYHLGEHLKTSAMLKEMKGL
jgi:DNA repair protein RecO (recombination protein O)